MNSQEKVNMYRRLLRKTKAELRAAAPEVLTWPVYQNEADREKEQVENVFGLGGGELGVGGAESLESFGGYLYNYEGAPEYAAREIEEPDYQYHTVIVTGGGLLSPPDKTVEDNGVTWELVEHFLSSGEADCWICGAGGNGVEWWAEEFEKEHGRPPTPEDECGLCEYKFKDMPGYTYIGEGYEAVYRVRDDVIWPEDEYNEASVNTAAVRTISRPALETAQDALTLLQDVKAEALLRHSHYDVGRAAHLAINQVEYLIEMLQEYK
jgi:hypothetical protein